MPKEINIELVFDDLREHGKSIYSTERGIEYTVQLHCGATFPGKIYLEEDGEHYFNKMLKDGLQPVFFVSKPSKYENLDSFLNLEENWDSYGAAKIDPTSIETMKEILDTLASEKNFIKTPKFVPTVQGGVQVEWDTHSDIGFELGVAKDIIEMLYTDPIVSVETHWKGPVTSNTIEFIYSFLKDF